MKTIVTHLATCTCRKFASTEFPHGRRAAAVLREHFINSECRKSAVLKVAVDGRRVRVIHCRTEHAPA